jgi:hypothetical protein
MFIEGGDGGVPRIARRRGQMQEVRVPFLFGGAVKISFAVYDS